MITYRNAVHEGYSGLNLLERRLAEELDKTGDYWMRNPSRGFFEIPLLDGGNTKRFNPDFLVWTESDLVAIDTKGDHILLEAAHRKLFYIQNVGNGRDLYIRFVSEGRYNEPNKLESYKGFTIWTLKQGKPAPTHCDTMAEAVKI